MRPGRRIAELAADQPQLAAVWALVLTGLSVAAVVTGDSWPVQPVRVNVCGLLLSLPNAATTV